MMPTRNGHKGLDQDLRNKRITDNECESHTMSETNHSLDYLNPQLKASVSRGQNKVWTGLQQPICLFRSAIQRGNFKHQSMQPNVTLRVHTDCNLVFLKG